MITLEQAKEEQYEELLALTYHQETAYLKPMLDLIQLTRDQFGRFFRTTGIVYRICVSGMLAGLCWVEEQENILYLHGLIIKDHFQGKGIGTEILRVLELIYQDRLDVIELKVHSSNPRAAALYQRCGFRIVRYIDGPGFYVMQKPLREQQPEIQVVNSQTTFSQNSSRDFNWPTKENSPPDQPVI